MSLKTFKKGLYTLLLCAFSTLAGAQIIAPDTVCVGTAVTFTTNKTATTYTWDFSSVSVDQPISPITTFYGIGLTNPTWTSFNKDGADYYCFVTDYFTEHVLRLSYGPSMSGTPVATDLGSFGMTGTDQEGIDIVKDTATGLWYGLVVDYNSMAVLSFGASLSSTPVVTVTPYPAHLFWPHQVTIKRYNGNWSAFVANRNAGISRFDFGSALTNPPVITDIPNVGGVANPCNFSLYQQGGLWYMLVTSLISGQISRYDFGSNLLNNSPTGTLLPSPSGMIHLPRYINLLNDCQGHLIGYMGNETGHILKLDFGGDITNPPIFTDLGPSGVTTVNACTPCAYSDSFCFLFVDYTGVIHKFFPLNLASPAFINYYNPSQTYTFTSPGTYNVSLFCDMGYDSGPYVYCKSIVVTTGFGSTHSRDTLICSGPAVLSADTSGSWLWNTGDTTSSITVTTGGTYWVTTTGPCWYKSDTIHVTIFDTPGFLGNDTAFCMGDSIVLAPPAPPGTSFTWNTGDTSSSIVVHSSGAYWVTMTNGSCVIGDTINITVRPLPVVDLGPDTSQCFAVTPIVLHSSGTYGAPVYLWSDGSTAPSLSVSVSGYYWLSVTDAGCTGSDTVNVTVATDTFSLSNNDTAICRGKSVQVLLSANPTATFQWLPTAGIPHSRVKNPLITPDTSAEYYVIISIPDCPDLKDSFYIDVQPVPVVYAGGDRSVCQFDTLHLHAAIDPNWYTHYAYNWTPAVNLDDSTKAAVVFTAGSDTKFAVTVTTPAGCMGEDSALVFVHPGNFARLDTEYTLCPHDSVQLLPSGGVSYRWHPGIYLSDSTVAAPWVHAVTSQDYTVIAVSAFGCLDTLNTRVTILPGAVLYLGDSTIIYPGESYHIQPQTNCVSFAWFPAVGLDNAYISDPVASPQINTKYIVHGRTAWGCEAVDSISIYCEKSSILALPNAFTPGSGVNNKLFILKRGEATLHYFRIYNRWGNKVFETTDIDEGWDGTFHGKPQPYDVYVYQVEAETSAGETFRRHGNVTLIR